MVSFKLTVRCTGLLDCDLRGKLDRISGRERTSIRRGRSLMPIFEYICRECERQFEVIVQGKKTVECPSCKGRKLERQLSVFAAPTKVTGLANREMPMAPCGSCGDPRGPGSCSLN